MNTRQLAKTDSGTELKVTLSEDLQKTLSHSNIDVFAVNFKNSSDPWTPLVLNGNVKNNGTTSIQLTSDDSSKTPATLEGGKIYFLIQEGDIDGQPKVYDKKPKNTLEKFITDESEINWSSAQKYNFRYDSFEVTLAGTSNDQGNLTSVNSFGLPMELKVAYDNGTTATAGYKIPVATDKNKNGPSLSALLDNGKSGQDASVQKFKGGALNDTFREAIAPATSIKNGLGAYRIEDWDQYLNDLKSNDHDIVIAGTFNGARDAQNIYHNGGYFSYEVEWRADDSAFWLTPTDASQIKGDIRFTEEDLSNSIYATNGNLQVFSPDDQKTPFQILDHPSVKNSDDQIATMGSGDNNQWGTVVRQLVTGFSAGYFGSTGKSLVEGGEEVDLSKSWNWDPTYAFGSNLSGAQPKHYDHYSKVFFDYSNSYGWTYSDELMSDYATGSPLVSVSEPGKDANVSEINLTIFDDKEQPEGYVAPTLYNHRAPEGQYAVASTENLDQGSTNSISLAVGNGDMVFDDSMPIFIDILTGYSEAKDSKGKTIKVPEWQSVELEASSSKTPLWQNWKFGGSDGQFSITPSSDTTITTGGKTKSGYVPQPTGNLLIDNFPAVENGVQWSRITFGTGDGAKTFNLFAEYRDWEFVNPDSGKGNDGALAVDGLAHVIPQTSNAASIETFKVDFMSSQGLALPSDVLKFDDAASSSQAVSAPVAAAMSGGKLKGLPNQNAMFGSDAKVTTAKNELAFTWTGDNPSPDTTSWISGYTNKIGALNTAEVLLTTGKSTSFGSVLGKADLDGQWHTGFKTFGNGTHTATMKEYLETDTKLTTPVGNESASLQITVDVAELGLAAAHGGQGLKLDASNGAGKGIDGNWVKVRSATAPLDSGSAVAIVLTDKSGAFANVRTGETGGVSLADATLGTLGGLSLQDAGATLKGTQSVYLPKGMGLKFVSLAPADWGDEGHTPAVTTDGNGAARVEVGGHVLQAEVDNSLSEAAALAHAQRETGEAFVHVREGQQIRVNVAGEAEGGNRLGFVHVAVDTTDGSWSVGGVDYGAAGFDAAVRDSLDGNFAIRGRGDFKASGTWTVAGPTGYYAPVLLTRSGDVIFAPAANGDPGDADAVRLMGQNLFAFEDGAGTRDFNDMVVRLKPVTPVTNGHLNGETTAPLVLEDRAIIGKGDSFLSQLPDEGGSDYGLTLLSTPDDPGRLAVKGNAIFEGRGGVDIKDGPAQVFVGEDGRLVLRGDGTVLSVADEDVVIRNHGLIRGDIETGRGIDIVTGSGTYDGTVDLGWGNDIFVGDAGDDMVRGRRGADIMRGGEGNDTLYAGRGADVIRGGAGDDDLQGRRGADMIFGGKGDDFLRGNKGNDQLFGRKGDDILKGNTGNDLLKGGKGADILQGGQGNDVMVGGPGADVFVLNLQNGNDRIRDFELDRDTLDLRAYGLDTGTAAQQVADAFAVDTGPDGMAKLDLSVLGGQGSVRFNGLDTTDASEITFLF